MSCCTRGLCTRVWPYVSEELKHAWIQYVSILVVVLFIVDWLKWFVYSRGLVSSLVRSDAPKPHTA
jgi:hypothetical protein